ncbi:serine hydrolase, partial [Paenibacillus sp. PsM32]|nr:serine hydrolase [Paenibacillus sp. PsM32]
QLPPAAMLLFGLLYLLDGQVKGHPLIQSSTVRHATSPLIAVDSPQKADYGWHWWHSCFTLDSQPIVDIPYYF